MGGTQGPPSPAQPTTPGQDRALCPRRRGQAHGAGAPGVWGAPGWAAERARPWGRAPPVAAARASPVGPSPRMPAAPCPSRTCSARAVPCDVFSSPCAVTRASRAFSQSVLSSRFIRMSGGSWRSVAGTHLPLTATPSECRCGAAPLLPPSVGCAPSWKSGSSPSTPGPRLCVLRSGSSARSSPAQDPWA